VALARLAPHLPADQGPAVLAQALGMVNASNDGDQGVAWALAELAPNLSTVQLTEALAAASAISYELARATALIGLAPYLSADQLTQALSIATAMTDSRECARALIGLVPHLSPDHRPAVITQTLAVISTITNENLRASELIDLAPHLSDNQLTHALDIASGIKHQWVRDRALSSLAPGLSADQLSKALILGSQTNPALLSRAAALGSACAPQDTLQLLRRALMGHALDDTLLSISAAGPIIENHGGPDAILECVEAIDAIRRWWP
jgi:hypothetical protein